MNNDSIQYADIINLIVNNDTSIIPYEKAREYVNAFRVWLICQLRMLVDNDPKIPIDVYEATINHCNRIIEASDNNGNYSEGFIDGLKFAIDYFKWMIKQYG